MKTKSVPLKAASSTKAKAIKTIRIEAAPFDAADYLDDNETIAAYLSAALTDPDPDVFLVAVKDVARARGMSQLAKDTQLGRESLYKALSAGAKPRYDTMIKVINALGVQLQVVPTATV
ncbi:MAG: addiction module antidote protein [Polaromonas sp.]